MLNHRNIKISAFEGIMITLVEHYTDNTDKEFDSLCDLAFLIFLL